MVIARHENAEVSNMFEIQQRTRWLDQEASQNAATRLVSVELSLLATLIYLPQPPPRQSSFPSLRCSRFNARGVTVSALLSVTRVLSRDVFFLLSVGRRGRGGQRPLSCITYLSTLFIRSTHEQRTQLHSNYSSEVKRRKVTSWFVNNLNSVERK